MTKKGLISQVGGATGTVTQTFSTAQTASSFAVSSVHLSRPETRVVIYRVPSGVFRADGVTLRFLATPEAAVSGNKI